MHSCRKDNGFAIVITAVLALLLALLFGLTGCGGGGGGTVNQTGNVTLLGRILLADTLAPVSSATITVNGHSTNSNPDGTFTLTGVAASATTATVAATGYLPRTLTLKILTGVTTLDLGDVYLSKTGYTASASGKVVTTVSSKIQAVGGASVTIAGTTVTTATDGTFSIPNLPLGLGTDPTTPIGTVRAKGFVDKPIISQFVFVAGDNPLGQLLIQTPVGATPPTLPYTIKVSVTHNGTPQPNTPIELLSNGSIVGSPVTTDASGNYYYWVVPGDYTVATFINGVQANQKQVTLSSPDVPQTVIITD